MSAELLFGMTKVLEIASGDGCTTLNVLMPLVAHFKMVEMVNFNGEQKRPERWDVTVRGGCGVHVS